MNINDTSSSSGSNASLHQGIVLFEICLVQCPSENIICEELPSNGKTEDVETIISDEMVHLASTIRAIVLGQWRPSGTGSACSVGVATEVKARNIDTGKLERACTSGGSAGARRCGAAADCRWGGGNWGSCGRSGCSGSWDALRIVLNNRN